MKAISSKLNSQPICVKPVDGVRIESDQRQAVTDRLTVEEALQININGQAFTITMRSPGDDEALVRGLLFTEGMVTSPDALLSFRYADEVVGPCENTIDVEVDESLLDKAVDADLRSMIATSSCGFCGKRDLRDLEISGPVEHLQPDGLLDAALLEPMVQQMSRQQNMFHASGGCHAAAAFTLPGQLLAVHEDVGRHNAVDKVIGTLLENGSLDRAQCLLVSGRVSYEIVSKAYRAAMPFLIAVSAPSSMAVQTANVWGMTLIGFCREQRATVYTNSEHVR